MKSQKYIMLYCDEFKIDIWEQYMQILDLPRDTKCIKIMVADIIKFQE